MTEKVFHAEVIDLSLIDKKMLDQFKILSIKKRFMGLLKIYTIEVPEKEIEQITKEFQLNIGNYLHKQWYITFHNAQRVIVVFQNKIFDLSGDGIVPISKKILDTSHAKEKEQWDELLLYAKTLGIPGNQCDFLPEAFQTRNYG